MQLKKLMLSSLIGSLGFYSPAWACTTILVGSAASSDGSIYVARNVDMSKPLRAYTMVQHPAINYPAGSEFYSNTSGSKFSYPRPAHALAYTAFPLVTKESQINDSFEEVGINEQGVAISATETIFNSPQVLKIDPYLTESGIDEDAIPSVILPAVKSAKQGVELLGKIIETRGTAEGFGVAFSDNDGIWYLETASGHHWVAFKLPKNKFFVSANQGRIQEVNLNDKHNFMSSPGLFEFARQNSWYPESGVASPKANNFNFFKIFIANGPHDITYNYPRVAYLDLLYTGDSKGNDGLFPMFQTPQHKLSLADVRTGLRLHYAGTEYDPYMTQNPKTPYRPAAVLRTGISHITQIRPKLPKAIGNVEYIAIGMTDLSLYIPFYQGITSIPDVYTTAQDGKIDDYSEFSKYRKLQVLVLQNYPKYAPLVHTQFSQFETSMAKAQVEMEREYLKTYKKAPKHATDIIQQFTDKWVKQADVLVSGLSKQIAVDAKLDKLSNEDYEELIIKTEKAYHFGGA